MYLLESSNMRRSRLALHRTVVSDYDSWAEHRHRYKDDGSSKMRPIFLEISFAHLREGLFCENDNSPIWDKPNELKKFVPNRETIFQRCKIEFQIGKPFFNVAKSNSKSGIHFSMLQNRILNRETIFQRCKAESQNGNLQNKENGHSPNWETAKGRKWAFPISGVRWFLNWDGSAMMQPLIFSPEICFLSF